MISNLISPSVSFKVQNSNSSVRNSYNEMLKKNEQIATKVNNAIENSINTNVSNTTNKQIPMQGNVGQKLDVTV